MMKKNISLRIKLVVAALLAVPLFFILQTAAFAQQEAVGTGSSVEQAEVPSYEPPINYYYRGEVKAILDEAYSDDPFIPTLDRFSQTVEVMVLSGPDKDSVLELSYSPGSTDGTDQNLKVGEKVVLVKTEQAGEWNYYIADRYRFTAIGWLAAAFLLLVIVFAGWKGVRSLVGLAFTAGVIFFFILPRIVDGGNPFVTFLIGGFVIATISIYLGHGLNRRTTIAVASTCITLLISIGISVFAVRWAKLFGLGTEEAFYLQIGDFASINLQGLLLGGIIIGILGVLDDITTAQAATVQEIYRANPKLQFIDLVKRGMSVGHEHVVSLVNTLVLAYAGASFPLLLLFTQNYTPLWISLNSERVIEEIVRTLIGSSALVIAVPITTYLAAYYFTKKGAEALEDAPPHSHHH